MAEIKWKGGGARHFIANMNSLLEATRSNNDEQRFPFKQKSADTDAGSSALMLKIHRFCRGWNPRDDLSQLRDF
jgi:hypothetical protein